MLGVGLVSSSRAVPANQSWRPVEARDDLCSLRRGQGSRWTLSLLHLNTALGGMSLPLPLSDDRRISILTIALALLLSSIPLSQQYEEAIDSSISAIAAGEAEVSFAAGVRSNSYLAFAGVAAAVVAGGAFVL